MCNFCLHQTPPHACMHACTASLHGCQTAYTPVHCTRHCICTHSQLRQQQNVHSMLACWLFLFVWGFCLLFLFFFFFFLQADFSENRTILFSPLSVFFLFFFFFFWQKQSFLRITYLNCLKCLLQWQLQKCLRKRGSSHFIIRAWFAWLHNK